MILAFEQSTRRGSIALCRGNEVLAHREWDDAFARHASLWPHLQDLVKETDLDWNVLAAIAVGRGPGSFSGLRAAITAARVLATPERTPVIALSSGAALAHDWFLQNRGSENPLIIAGDARRGTVWYAIFHASPDGAQQTTDWTLAPAREFPTRIPPRATIATSDRARLIAALGEDAARILPIADDTFPTAHAVAQCAQHRLSTHTPSDPYEPLYLHPATLG